MKITGCPLEYMREEYWITRFREIEFFDLDVTQFTDRETGKRHLCLTLNGYDDLGHLDDDLLDVAATMEPDDPPCDLEVAIKEKDAAAVIKWFRDNIGNVEVVSADVDEHGMPIDAIPQSEKYFETIDNDVIGYTEVDWSGMLQMHRKLPAWLKEAEGEADEEDE